MYTNAINHQKRTLCESLSPDNKISVRSNISISCNYTLCLIHSKSLQAKCVFYWGKIVNFQIFIKCTYDMDKILPMPHQNYRLKKTSYRTIEKYQITGSVTDKKKWIFLWLYRYKFTLGTNANRQKFPVMEIQRSPSAFLYTTLHCSKTLKIKCHMFLEETNTDTQVKLILTPLFRELTHAE